MAVMDDIHTAHNPATWLNRLWPAAFGAAFAAFNMIGLAGGADLAPLLAAAGFVYIGAAAVRRPGAAWPLFWLVFVVIGVARVFGGPDSTWIILGMAALIGVYGLVRGAARDRDGLPRQALAMVVIGAVTTLTLTVGGDFGAYLVSAALLAHSAWDAWHIRTGKVVSRSMAEFCFVLDAVVAIALIVVVVAG